MSAPEPTRRTLVFPAVEVPRPRRLSPSPPPIPPARPSERPTLKTLPPEPPSSGDSNTEVIELSASALDSEISLLDLEPLLASRSRPASGSRPGFVKPRWEWRGGVIVAVVAAAVGVGAGGAEMGLARVTGVSDQLHGPPREVRQPASQHTALAPRVDPGPAAGEGTAPRRACAAAGAPRMLAGRASLASGLDVNVHDGGFGVGFASDADEALGLRLDGSSLRVAERVRVRARPGTRVRHVAVDAADGDGDDDALDVRVDADGGRTVVPEHGAPSFRMSVVGGFVQVAARGAAGKTLWPVPGSAKRPTTAPDVRAASRDEGGAVVVLRRPSALWLGFVDEQLAAEGPLVALSRSGAALGMPSVAAHGSGGAVAWAERPAGERDWIVMVASFGDATAAEPVLRPIAAGMSPSIAALPGGDLLLAYAVGASGAHRVVVRRLGRDLVAHGDEVLVSPDAVNAGQPAAAAAPDGRALVAFFGAERGRPPRVHATALSCRLEP